MSDGASHQEALGDDAREPNVFGIPDRFAEAWVNVSHVVCGERMPIYSMHTHLMLSVMENPLALESVPQGYRITWEDLWLAIAAVKTPYGGETKFPAPWLCIFKQRWKRLSLEREVAKFRAWQNDYLSTPDVFCTEGDGRPLTAPGILARAVFLQRHLHLSDERVWTMPIGQAMWQHAATLEQINDNVSLLEDKEAALFDLLKRIQDGTADESDLPPNPATEAQKRDDERAAWAESALGIPRTK